MFYDTSDLKTAEIFLRLEKTCEAQPEKRYKTYIGGNIGYGIDEPYRGHHYAAKACGLLFQLARKHSMEYVIITCDPANTASSRTCQLAGGKYIETADIPEDNEMYAEGKRQVMIYRFDL